MQNQQLEISAEMTPNPNTLKFNANRVLVEENVYDFPNVEKAADSYLASELFALGHVTGVYIGRDFITVTKTVETQWTVLAPQLVEKMKAVLSSGKELVSPNAVPSTNAVGETEIEKKIQAVLDEEIRPAVARDGGDIIFYGYKDGVVTLHLQGACSSCPSSIMTLKMGVENRLKQIVPEIKEVVQV